MSVTCTESDRCMTAFIRGELDHHRARQVMAELERQMDAALPVCLTLELGELTFADSSGIAVLVRVWRRMRQLGGTVLVKNTPEQARKVFYAAGLQKLMPFE